MGIKAIHYRDGQFCNNSSTGPGAAALGKDIVNTLLSGSEGTRFGVTVNYAVEMLRIVGRTGKFYDRTDWCSGDHDFDPNVPTLGDDWAEVRAMRQLARGLAYEGKDLRDSEELHTIAPLLALAGEVLHAVVQELENTNPVTYPFRNSTHLPAIKCNNPKIGAEAIWYDSDADVFNFGGYQLGVDKLGRLIGTALMRGDEKLDVGGIEVTVNYLVQMCRLVGRNGEFCDYNDELFNGNVPPRDGVRDTYEHGVRFYDLDEDDSPISWRSLR